MDPQPVPPEFSFQDFARLFDHQVLTPELADIQVVESLQVAKRNGVACAVVRPCDVELAVRTLQGSALRVGSVCAWPHGIQNTATKLYEVRDLLRRGAFEIDLAVTASKLISREFQHVQTELAQFVEACHKEGAVAKVMLDTALLSDELKIIACRVIERAGADFVSAPYRIDDVKLLRKYLPEEIRIKVAGEIGTADQVIELISTGCARVGTTATAAILEQWKSRQSSGSGT
jgi:deoxyribose-phosphate aldolase